MLSITLNLPEGHPMTSAILALLAASPAPVAQTAQAEPPKRAKRTRKPARAEVEETEETETEETETEAEETETETEAEETEAEETSAVTAANYKDPVVVEHAKGKGTVTVTRLAGLMRRALDAAGPDAIKAIFKKAGVSRLDDLPPAKVSGVVAQLNKLLED